MLKLLTVIGATGIQGSSVVEAALRAGSAWSVRAITRDPTSKTARALHAKGVEVVKADLNDRETLRAAFAGSYAIFSATDFFGPFVSQNYDVEKAKEIEWTQTKNIIDVASATTCLEHFVYSTLPNAQRISKGKYSVAHFEGKNRGEDYIKAHPALLAKTTFLWIAWYASNFQYPMFQITPLASAGTLVQLGPTPADTVMPTIGSAQDNVGIFALAALEQPEKALGGRYVNGMIEWSSLGKLVEDWSEVAGKKAIYVQTTLETWDALWPGWGRLEGPNLQLYDEFGETCWDLAEGEGVPLTAEDLGLKVEEMVGVKEALRRMGVESEASS